MKQQVVALIVAIGLLGTLSTISMASNKISKNESKLPKISKEFLQKHFPNDKISFVIEDKEGLRTTYEVMLTSGKEIEFSKNGEWKEVDTKKEALPQGIVSEKIASYVKNNFDDKTYLVQIKKTFWGTEVELSNKLELEFSASGRFLRYDN